MHITDPIADMLTRIRNANSARHDTVDVPASAASASPACVFTSARTSCPAFSAASALPSSPPLRAL